MPNPVNNRRGEHWVEDSITGFPFPLSEITIQRGLPVARIYADAPNRDYFMSQLELPEDESPPLILPDPPVEETAP